MNLTADEERRFSELAAPYVRDELFLSMDGFVQHGAVSTFDHSVRVARASFLLARRLHLTVDEPALVAGALLHDFYLYDWHGSGWRHSYLHPRRARKNAAEHFGVGPRVQGVIASHMWPLTIAHPPRSREALLVCVCDKVCSLYETLFLRRPRVRGARRGEAPCG